ncbi:hypothetical protein Q4Q34_09010 [Flavivirga abyssicola]|uniref:hypothetical protein n=1 Tax=Flavivirga abyssicola TaxID=3063533 RepID=UPI0026DFD2B9|nr:hypothetical protein [Flavivirga sp. MEBiC07777]WVK15166.1 hypothetical protein Q4Q34_09010 [Flavivirga sp. MEBiC07777]
MMELLSIISYSIGIGLYLYAQRLRLKDEIKKDYEELLKEQEAWKQSLLKHNETT